MGDYVSVNPERLSQLAAALKDAATLVPSEKSTITSNITGWDGHWDAAKVDALTTWLEGEWRAMADRADLAATAAHQPVLTTLGDPHASWRGIPWDITPEVLAQEGLQDAINLRGDLASGDSERVDRARAELAAAMDAHSDDPAWLQAFLGTGGAEVIDTANRATLGDHLPISDEGQHQLASYARGLAAATTLLENGTITAPPDVFATLYDDDSVMATGVMMKFGPTGDQYGAHFLAGCADAALDWRQHHPPRPGYSEGGIVGTGYVPGGYVQDDDDWWTRYDINVSYLDADADEAARGIQLIQDYDPTVNILAITGDNPEASRLLLTGADGLEHAHQLVQYDWATPPGIDNSFAPGKVIRAATLDRTGPEAQASAQAAANVFQAGYDLAQDDPRNDYTRELYPELPASLAQSLSTVASAYAVDMAMSTAETDSGVNHVVQDPALGYVLQTNVSVMDEYLKLFMNDPTAAGSFQGSVNAQLTNAAAATARWPDTFPDLLRQTGYLNGMVAIATSDLELSDAEARDATNAREKTYVEAVIGTARIIPGVPDAGKLILGAIAVTEGATKETLFPTGAAAAYTSDAQFIMNQGIADMRVYVAQGYADAGVYEPPAHASFVHDGVISPQSDAERAAFDNWYSRMPNQYADLNDAPAGFESAAVQFAPGDDKFTDPK
jgi:hypothetical protein